MKRGTGSRAFLLDGDSGHFSKCYIKSKNTPKNKTFNPRQGSQPCADTGKGEENGLVFLVSLPDEPDRKENKKPQGWIPDDLGVESQ